MVLTRLHHRMISGADPNITDTIADTNGLTDSTAILQALLNSAATRGGRVNIGDARLLILGNLTIPPGVTLMGHWEGPGDLTRNSFVFGGNAPTFGTMGSALLLGPGVTIFLGAGGAMRGLMVQRNGINHPVVGGSSFNGTAVVVEGDDCYVGYCLFLGHAIGVDSDKCGRHKYEWIFGDCLTGIRIVDSWDVTRVVNCHFWPFLSANTGAVVPESVHHRSGVGFDIKGLDIGIVTDCFAYGYFRGFRVVSVGAGTFAGCASDGTLEYPGSIGFDIGTGLGATGTRFIGCTAFSCNNGFWINIPTGDYVSLTNCQCSAIPGTGVYVFSGDVGIQGGLFAATLRNIHIDNTSSKVSIVGSRFNSATAPITSLSPHVIVNGIDTGPLALTLAPVGVPNCRRIVSADPLAINPDGEVFEVLGTTNFGTITGGYAGRKITLIFAGALTVVDGGNLNIAGNFTTTAGSTLSLVHNGTAWLQTSRSNN